MRIFFPSEHVLSDSLMGELFPTGSFHYPTRLSNRSEKAEPHLQHALTDKSNFLWSGGKKCLLS